MGDISIVGFDSAWTDNPKAPGAICALTVDGNGGIRFKPPRLASFEQALEFIRAEQAVCDLCLVALDQPTIVPNLTGGRPVERVVGSLISFIGGGVQPSNRSGLGMFDDEAPIWRFKTRLGAVENPEVSRAADRGLFIIEVFPALALPAFQDSFSERLCGPRYNPARRKTFRIAHWITVLEMVALRGQVAGIDGIVAWAIEAAALTVPRKADQDRLDAVLCALIGYHWRVRPREESIVIGDLVSGYMIAPTSPRTKARLALAAAERGVAVDGTIL